MLVFVSASAMSAFDSVPDCKVIGLTGRDGGALKAHCQNLVIAASNDTAHIQEVHIVVIHLLCALIEEQLDWAALQ